MGQYFKLVNTTKKQVVRPHDVDDGAKFLELVGGTLPQVLVFLIAKSDEGGGGDGNTDLSLRGSWAGDNIVLVGDYDSSELYQQSDLWENISVEALAQFNRL